MELFSTTVAAIELGHFCYRLIKFLKDVHTAAKSVGDEINALITEVDSLRSTVALIEQALKDGPVQSLSNLNQSCTLSLKRCRDIVNRLESVVQEIYGPNGPDVTGQRDVWRKESRRPEKQNFQVLLIGFGVLNEQKSHDKLDRILEEVQSLDREYRKEVAEVEKRIRASGRDEQDADGQAIATLFSFCNSLRSVSNAVLVTTSNEFFDPPSRAFLSPANDQPIHRQLRFVVYGIDGSGKTGFCPKFAELNRSSRSARWLLFLDNADDPLMELHDYFPKGDHGHIIIITRNPDHKVYGNAGPGFFKFQGLEENESSTLLLRSARLAEPWDAGSLSFASKISRQLGFLALALVHAGATIRRGICSVKNYLAFYDDNWEPIRRTSISTIDFDHEGDQNMSALVSYEVSYRGLEQKGTQRSKDAIELLKLFSFFYNKDIRFDILRKAVCNEAIEKAAQENVVGEESSQPNPGYFDEYRVRSALVELVRMSLVTHDKSTDSYSMHPLIHRWTRERPGMRTSEQAVWSHIAVTVLAQSILRPPLGMTEADEWPGTGARFGREQALRYAKFNIVFMQTGRWNGTATLQLAVKEYTDRVLGLDQPVSRQITLALATTYRQLGREDEAEALQELVIQACIATLGLNSYETLMAMDLLGQSRWQQGRYSDAKALQEPIVDGLVKLRGLANEDTLTAIYHLGRTIAKFYEDLEKGKRLLMQAFGGMSEMLGPTHVKTLWKKRIYLSLPSEMLQEVLGTRKEKLGKEHPFTLLAMATLATVKTAIGQHDQAEVLVRHGLSIADRNLGEGHIGTLMGRTVLGIILTNKSTFAEAEPTLLDLGRCYMLQRKLEESIQCCDEAISGLQKISSKPHPLERKMRERKTSLLEMKGEAS
ncbi:hypothetical protein BDW69DRAFT_198030 [Aspergillus filifer]